MNLSGGPTSPEPVWVKALAICVALPAGRHNVRDDKCTAGSLQDTAQHSMSARWGA
jgi:hypothetical protein